MTCGQILARLWTRCVAEFAKNWKAEVLRQAPLIAPARQYTWPQEIAGEEDALARGALRVMVKPRLGAGYLLTCALGFNSPNLPSGVFGCPDADEMCAVAGGYAYVASTLAPEKPTLLGMKPVVALLPAVEAGLLLFVGFHAVLAWGRGGIAWETGRLSWEGVRVEAVSESEAVGFGWDMRTDKEVAFRIDLRTGEHVGGGFGLGKG